MTTRLIICSALLATLAGCTATKGFLGANPGLPACLAACASSVTIPPSTSASIASAERAGPPRTCPTDAELAAQVNSLIAPCPK